jgi:hypothetical protein
MNPVFLEIFQLLKHEHIAIVGSALQDFESAHDIDVLVIWPSDYQKLVKRLGIKYCGWDSPNGHIRRANWRIPATFKPIQLLSNSKCLRFDDWPHIVLLRTGDYLHDLRHYDRYKKRDTFHE